MDDRIFFDKLAPDWDNNEIVSTPEKVNEILDFIQLSTGDSVLDLGTGTGVLLPYIAERIGEKGKITAVDFSEGMLNRAKEKFCHLTPEPEFLNIDFENENIEGEFDKILLYCVYPHLHTPIDTLKWLCKVNLKQYGAIFIAFPCSENFINNIHKERHSESGMLPSAPDLTRILLSGGINAETILASEKGYIVKIMRQK